MNLNHISVVVMAGLCWMSLGTYAQNTTSVPASVTSPNASCTGMTTNGNSSSTNTTALMPTTNGTMEHGNYTTMAPGNTTMMTAGNTTAAPFVNATRTPSGNTTMDPSGNTTMTPSGNATTAAPTTQAPPIETNTTVTTLAANISTAGCTTDKLCAANPSGCAPSPGSCFFVSANPTSGRNFRFELSGNTQGYVCTTLAPGAGGNQTAYICAKTKENTVTFICATLSNGAFTNQDCPVNNVKGSVTGNHVQCSFDVTVPDTTTVRGAAATHVMTIQTGAYNEASGALGTPTLQHQTAPIDLSDPKADTNNTLSTNSTTAAPPVTTAAGAVTLQLSISKALLIILGALSLAWL